MTIIDTTITYNGKDYHIVVSQPSGAGSYHVYENNYFRGQIVWHTVGWTPFISKTEVLNSDDIGAILDIINEQAL